MKNRRKKKRESGQAMVEFALVLPIFLLLVMGILDFGFLFYNYISLENSARNAARIACVSYDNIAINHPAAGVENGNDSPNTECTLALPTSDATLASSYAVGDFNKYSSDEKKICMEVARSINSTGFDAEGRTVTISYSYDTSEEIETDGNWKAKNRYKGDVTVSVSGKAHVLTPVLGVASDHMLKPLKSTSVYKVEQQYDEG